MNHYHQSLASAAEAISWAQIVITNRTCPRVAQNKATCLTVEDRRIKSQKIPHARRDPERMCGECAAYEYLIRALELVDDAARIERVAREAAARQRGL